MFRRIHSGQEALRIQDIKYNGTHPMGVSPGTFRRPLKVFFVMDKMEHGGTERQLIELLKGLTKSIFDVTLIMFHQRGGFCQEISNTPGIRVVCLSEQRRCNLVRILYRFIIYIGKQKPVIIHSYLLGINELCLLVGLLLKVRIVWGVRVSNLNFTDFTRRSRFIFRIGIYLSRFTQKVIVNSEAGRAFHADHGYPVEKMTVIHNGIDTVRFRPKPPISVSKDAEMDTETREYVIGVVGRIHPMKDHPTFLRAASLLLKKRNDVRFVCIGDGDGRYKEALRKMESRLMISDRVHWTGPVSDMARAYRTMDIASSCSAYGEGFSNVIGEAMACGVPCVVTDVGDSATIVGKTGIVIKPGNPDSLAGAWETILDMTGEEKTKLCHAARKRILERFSVQNCIQKTEAVLLDTASESAE